MRVKRRTKMTFALHAIFLLAVLDKIPTTYASSSTMPPSQSVGASCEDYNVNGVTEDGVYLTEKNGNYYSALGAGGMCADGVPVYTRAPSGASLFRHDEVGFTGWAIAEFDCYQTLLVRSKQDAATPDVVTSWEESPDTVTWRDNPNIRVNCTSVCYQQIVSGVKSLLELEGSYNDTSGAACNKRPVYKHVQRNLYLFYDESSNQWLISRTSCSGASHADVLAKREDFSGFYTPDQFDAGLWWEKSDADFVYSSKISVCCSGQPCVPPIGAATDDPPENTGGTVGEGGHGDEGTTVKDGDSANSSDGGWKLGMQIQAINLAMVVAFSWI